MAKPCVHGEVCREYLKQGRGIICQTCPKGCSFYKPKKSAKENDKSMKLIGCLMELDPVGGWRPAK